jgi:hypothetical protein
VTCILLAVLKYYPSWLFSCGCDEESCSCCLPNPSPTTPADCCFCLRKNKQTGAARDGLRVEPRDELVGLDLTHHGERAYYLFMEDLVINEVGSACLAFC